MPVAGGLCVLRGHGADGSPIKVKGDMREDFGDGDAEALTRLDR